MVRTDLGEKSYMEAGIWRDFQYRQFLIDGAQQGFSTMLPEVSFHQNIMELNSFLDSRLESEGVLKLAFDNETGSVLERTGASLTGKGTVIMAFGTERGWSEKERELLAASGYRMTSLGKRILRTETACAFGLGLVYSAFSLY